MADCSQLGDLADFSDYVDLLRDETGFQRTQMQPCRVEICTAIYGTGNPDISGIGVAVGYVLEIALGILLTLAIIFLKPQSEHGQSRNSRVLDIFLTGLQSFFDAAAYFAIALQLATISVLVQKDFGISTADLGALEAQIAQAVSIVSMVPLLYPVALLEGVDGAARHNLRLLLLMLAVALSFYPFLSRCIHAFGKSPIGTGEDAEVETVDWNVIERMCFDDGLDGLRDSNVYKAVEEIQLTVTLIIYLVALWHLTGLLDQHYLGATFGKKSKSILARRRRANKWFGKRRLVALLPLLALLSLTVTLLWVVFHLRKVQEKLAESTQSVYEGNEWGYGQIVSIVLFIPVGVDMFYRWRFGVPLTEGPEYGRLSLG